MTSAWEIIFWVSAFLIFYAFGGYGIVVFFILKIRSVFIGPGRHVDDLTDAELPDVCLIIAAYNERDYVDLKISNSLSLDYPADKISIVWVNDGSDDGTPELVGNYPEVTLLHNPCRSGKIEAMNRGAEFSSAPILFFTDANTMLSPNSIRAVVRHFNDRAVGCVAGEKRFFRTAGQHVAAAGEGLYWKIESWLKRLDHQFYSTIGATGELFAVRKELFQRVEPDTILDDFMISMRIARQGYKIAYEPEAIATETGSSGMNEELKRKVRIAAGCYQSLFRLKRILNPFFNLKLCFQYVSHKVLRWTLAPLALITLLISNIVILFFQEPHLAGAVYGVMLFFQVCVYSLALWGLLTHNNPVRLKFIYSPFYFMAMNYAMVKGFFRFLKGSQSVLWEKSKRA